MPISQIEIDIIMCRLREYVYEKDFEKIRELQKEVRERLEKEGIDWRKNNEDEMK